ncbi:MAG: AMIN domain-containing protein, partial [Hyphomicrobiales bacterium]
MAIFRHIIQNALRTVFARVFLLAILMVLAGLATKVGAQTIVEKQANPPLVNDLSIPKARLSALHVVGAEETVRLVLDVSRAVDVKSFVLSAPYRFVIDLADTELDLKNNRNNGSPGFLKKVSFGTIDNNLSRLVVEAGVPFAIENQFFVSESNGQGKRLVIDLVKSTDEAFRLVIAQQDEERRLTQKEAEQTQQALKQDAKGNKTEHAAKEDQ